MAKDGIELDEETQLLATLTRDQLKAQEGEIIKIINGISIANKCSEISILFLLNHVETQLKFLEYFLR